MGLAVTHVDYVCPKCLFTLKQPISKDDTVTWVHERTRHYAHAGCYDTPQEDEGVDNGGTMVATD